MRNMKQSENETLSKSPKISTSQSKLRNSSSLHICGHHPGAQGAIGTPHHVNPAIIMHHFDPEATFGAAKTATSGAIIGSTLALLTSFLLILLLFENLPQLVEDTGLIVISNDSDTDQFQSYAEDHLDMPTRLCSSDQLTSRKQ